MAPLQGYYYIFFTLTLLLLLFEFDKKKKWFIKHIYNQHSFLDNYRTKYNN
jgi:hypothetical protein